MPLILALVLVCVTVTSGYAHGDLLIEKANDINLEKANVLETVKTNQYQIIKTGARYCRSETPK